MPRMFIVLLAGLLALGLVACGDDDEAAGDPTVASGSDDSLQVVATTAQIGALVQEVAGDQVDLTVLMPPGVDPHDLELTPDDMRVIGDADLILKNGIGLDDFLDENIESAGGDAEIVVVTTGIDPIEGGRARHEEDEHEEERGEFDPHVWHDPANAALMVDNIVAALASADPDLAATYEENGEGYKKVLEETDADIRALLDEIPAENRKLVSTHDAFGYFIRAYDFEFIGAVIPGVSTGSEPSAQDIAELSEVIRNENVKAIFAEDTVDPRVAEQLASDTGVEIVYGLHSDSLGEPGSGAETIHGMLLANAEKISEALK